MSARQAEADAAREQRKREKYGERAFGGPGPGAAAAGADPHGYFRTLGLDRSKTVLVEEIKAAFRREALKLHPDVAAASDRRTDARADDEAFQRLHHAYTECLRIKLAEDAR